MTVDAAKRKPMLLKVLLCAALMLGVLPAAGQTGIFLKTEIVSGTITAIQDNAVELDGAGVFYYPAGKNVKMELPPGSLVTLRFYMDNSDKPIRKYVEYAAGRNALEKKAPPRVKTKMK